jgi:hypothetical protein
VQIHELAADDLNATVMCVGHNRGWEEAASCFTGRDVHLKTASAALLQMHAATWHEAMQSDDLWELVGLVTAESGYQAPAEAAEPAEMEVQGDMGPPATA